jgi:hypothetical protein
MPMGFGLIAQVGGSTLVDGLGVGRSERGSA